jgi:hypothetical protein
MATLPPYDAASLGSSSSTLTNYSETYLALHFPYTREMLPAPVVHAPASPPFAQLRAARELWPSAFLHKHVATPACLTTNFFLVAFTYCAGL